MDPLNLKSSFQNPADPLDEIVIVFDPCHCLKLMRGALHQYKVFLVPNSGLVKFKFFKDIVQVQEESGLKAANKLTTRHIEFQREKMKVKLAAQVFSNSVGKTLELGRQLEMTCFFGSEATQTFCHQINDLFDILNTRSLLGKGMKFPITQENIESRHVLLIKILNMLLSMQTEDGKLLICMSPRRIAVIGFSMSILSVLGIATKYMENLLVARFLIFFSLTNFHRITLNFF